MSKESYIRGFCKAAAAHGVDPEKLAKYAAADGAAKSSAKLPTGGYAPKAVVELGTGSVPLYRPPQYSIWESEKGRPRPYGDNFKLDPTTDTAAPLKGTHQLSDMAQFLRGDSPSEMSKNPAVIARAKAKPGYWNWLIAHIKSLGKVRDAAKGVTDVAGTGAGVEDPNLNKMLAELYHNNMYALTNGTARASTTAAK